MPRSPQVATSKQASSPTRLNNGAGRGAAPVLIADELAEARKLIEAGWCQRAWARDVAGDKVIYDSPDAICFCARGALWRVSTNGETEYTFEQAIDCDDIATWNDAPERTQAEVIDAFKRAEQIARDQVQP